MSLNLFREPNQVKWVGFRPAHRGAQVASDAGGTDGTFILHTVTAGKTLFLCGMTFENNDSGTGHVGTLRVRNDTDVAQYDLAQVFIDAIGQIITSKSYWPPLEIPALWDVVVISSAAGLDTRGFIHGWEE